MTIALSINALTDNILALAAMRRAVGDTAAATLSRDRRPAIARLARGAAASIALALMPEITGCNVLDEPAPFDTAANATQDNNAHNSYDAIKTANGTGDITGNTAPADEIITFTLRDSCMADPVVLRLLIEHAFTAFILSEIYSPSDASISSLHADDYAASLRRLTRTVTSAAPSVRLRPYPA